MKNMNVLVGNTRVARIPVSDMAAALYNGSMSDINEILEFAAAHAGGQLNDLLEQSRVVIAQGNGLDTAFGMSLSDSEIALELNRVGIETPDNFHCDNFGDMVFKNVSALEIITEFRQQNENSQKMQV